MGNRPGLVLHIGGQSFVFLSFLCLSVKWGANQSYLHLELGFQIPVFSVFWGRKGVPLGIWWGHRLREVLVSVAMKGPFAHPGQIPLCSLLPGHADASLSFPRSVFRTQKKEMKETIPS